MNRKILLSFVIPCYKSEDTVAKVIDEIVHTVLEKNTEYDYEIIAVNDCSPDDVYKILEDIAESNERIKLIELTKNMNKQSAQMAAFSKVKGEIIITLDDDGQSPTNRLWDLIQPLHENADVSFAKYPEYKQGKFKNIGSIMNKIMTNIVLDKPKDIVITNFGAIKRPIIDEIVKYTNPYPYMTGLLLRTTNRIVNVPMEQRKRISGKTTYTFAKLVSLWMNGFTAFSVKPLRIATLFGVLFAIVGFVYGIYTIVHKILNPSTPAGYSSIMSVLLFCSGMIMMLLGLIGEYIGRIYISMNNSPQYVIRKTKNFDEDKKDEIF